LKHSIARAFWHRCGDGGPGNPLSDEELARKFHDNAVRSLPEERAAELGTTAKAVELPGKESGRCSTGLRSGVAGCCHAYAGPRTPAARHPL
jgi:hypothetical protein